MLTKYVLLDFKKMYFSIWQHSDAFSFYDVTHTVCCVSIHILQSNNRPRVFHNINFKTWRIILQTIRVFTSHFISIFKSDTFYQKILFHVAAAVDGQRSSSAETISNFSGSAETLGALIWNSDWWAASLQGSQGESDSHRFIPPSSAAQLTSRCHSHTCLHEILRPPLLVIRRA